MTTTRKTDKKKTKKRFSEAFLHLIVKIHLANLQGKESKQCAIGPYFADCTKALYCDSDERHLATAPSIGAAKKLLIK